MRRKADQLIPLEISVLEAAIALQRSGIRAFHGYSLARVMQTSSDSRMLTAHGTLYRALQRLERAGLLAAFWEDADEAVAEGRPRRRLYRLTALAEVALSRARAQQRSGARLRSLEEGLEPG